MDTFDDTFSPLPEETTPLEEPPVQEVGTAPEEAVPEETVPEEAAPEDAAPEDAAPETPRAPRSPYEDSPYESFYGTHEQPQPRKPRRKLPPFWGTVALVAAGCLLTGLITASAARKQTAEQTAYLYDRIARLETRLAALGNTGGNASTPLPAGEVLTPAQVYAQNAGSVVGISCDAATTVSGQTLRRSVTGSGFIITSDGYIVTNYHVVENADSITVNTQSGEQYEGTLIGRDTSADMAVLKIEAEDLTPVTLGSSASLAIGDMVIAIGNPLSALEATQTVGYISGKNREVTTDSNVVNMLQTDVAINSGNSGGPLFNTRGEVVGITTAKYSGTTSSGASIEGISFAIPIDDLKKSIEDLQTNGFIRSAYIGIRGMDVDAVVVDTYGLPKGAYVESVEPGFAAEAAGLQPKDIIVGLGDESVTSFNSLARALRAFQAGDETTIRIYRSGSYLEKNITLSERPREETATQEQPTASEERYEDFSPFGGGNP